MGWAEKASTCKTKLERIQRLGVGGIANMRQTTPMQEYGPDASRFLHQTTSIKSC